MMKPPNNTRAKDLDKGFLSASHRLGVALGPLLQLWSLGREARDANSSVPAEAVNTLIEKTLVSLGQVNAAILFSRRKNLLARFFGDTKKAGELVVRNQNAFTQNEDALFGEVFHEALYKRSQGSKHLREARKEFGDRWSRGRGRGAPWRIPHIHHQRSPLGQVEVQAQASQQVQRSYERSTGKSCCSCLCPMQDNVCQYIESENGRVASREAGGL